MSKTLYTLASEVLVQQVALGTAAQADVARYSYSANGAVASLTDARGNRTGYNYDGFDRLAETHYPSPSSPGVSSGSDYTGVAYDVNGNVVLARLRDGQLASFGYDALDRVTARTPGTGAPQTLYSYDLLGRTTVISRAADGVTHSFGYDALGRLTGEVQPFGSMAYQYDLGGRRVRQSWNDGFYVTNDYLVTGEVSVIRENGVAALATHGYGALGQRLSLTRGNGTVSSYAYDPLLRLASLGHDMAGTAQDVTSTFSYNPASQIAARSRSNDAYA